jgi:intracellular multiplication protein IcmB
LQIPEGVEGFVSQLIDMAYKATENPESQFHYETGRDLKVDTALAEIRQTSERDERWWETVTWWEVVDMLFDAGHPQLAASAQRFAVPEFTMLSSIAASEQLSNLYPELRVNETSETIQQYVIRHLRDVATTFPCSLAARVLKYLLKP